MGRLLKNRRAGEEQVAWHRPNLNGPDTLELRSEAFADGATMPTTQAGRRVGGRNLSPALAWDPAPAGTAQLLFVMEDPDVPMSTPAVHTLALIDPKLTALDAGALDAKAPADGVRILRSTILSGYHGPEPIKGHGPHRYVFQLFALETALDGAALAKARPREVLASVGGPVLARGRLDGFYER
ncbi:YbhB/YbcL family Raf kinase inhibitor-like protein [Streptacidiphilus neutrinimicus]|uniref:YbhB/YbcL family Raf kinase inhibitor-like protein n=1 Tax=Streptacidiphilus neutrinimicus TaxID=105420 RepID=UPI0005A66282|nr:YbhB/YbcL family Raf kinase inhibitor-like protein [Streptacidiphilus neutrinimicus]